MSHMFIIFICLFAVSVCPAYTRGDAMPVPLNQNDAYNSGADQVSVTSARTAALSAFAHVTCSDQPSAVNSFRIRRARMKIQSDLNNRMELKMQMDIAGSQPKLLDAELCFQLLPSLVLTAGQFKIPISHENLTSVRTLRFIQWSQVVDALCSRGRDITGNQCGRDTGLRVTGSVSYTHLTLPTN